MLKLPFAAVLLTATPLFAQQTGVSHPDETEIETSAAAPAVSAPKSVPVVSAPVLVVPASNLNAPAPTPASSDSPAVTLKHHDLSKFTPAPDPDAGIVGDDVAQSPNEIAAGTIIRARLKTTIETATTQPGTPFQAEIAEPVLHDGRVIVPAGSMLKGHVTEVRGGRRIHGQALIHLQAQTIVLPDGSQMPLQASVIDTDQFKDVRVDAEGNILRKDHTKQTLAIFSLTTGSAAAAGGMIAGVPGALVGAGIGAGVSTALWLKQDRQAELPVDSLVVLALTEPLRIQPLIHEPDFAAQPTSAPLATRTVPVPPVAPEPQAFVPVN